MRKVKLEELLLYISERYPEKIQQLRHLSDETDNDLLIRQAVTANIYNVVTIEELAFLCHMSLSTFKRRFARIYGTSPNKWLLEKRMQKAGQLVTMLRQAGFTKLSSTDLSTYYRLNHGSAATHPVQFAP